MKKFKRRSKSSCLLWTLLEPGTRWETDVKFAAVDASNLTLWALPLAVSDSGEPSHSLSVTFTIQWVIVEQGCFSYSMVVVPLYDTLGADAITYIVNKGMSLSLCHHSPRYRLDSMTLHLYICLEGDITFQCASLWHASVCVSSF
jgi:hypothetical protein